MLETENLIYFDIAKTAGTHIRRILKEVLTEELTSRRKHGRVSERNNKFKLCSIRNPWDWYVSLWTFGCQGKGNLWDKLKTNYSHLYDQSDLANFREWLKFINEPELLKKGIFENPLYSSKAYKSIGIYTYRYLTTIHPKFKETFSNQLENYAGILDIHEKKDDIDYYIRVHKLESDLISALEQAEIPLKENYREIINNFDPTNTSRESDIPFTEYYDRETSELVYDREKLIVDQFDFHFSPNECITVKFSSDVKAEEHNENLLNEQSSENGESLLRQRRQRLQQRRQRRQGPGPAGGGPRRQGPGPAGGPRPAGGQPSASDRQPLRGQQNKGRRAMRRRRRAS